MNVGVGFLRANWERGSCSDRPHRHPLLDRAWWEQAGVACVSRSGCLRESSSVIQENHTVTCNVGGENGEGQAG